MLKREASQSVRIVATRKCLHSHRGSQMMTTKTEMIVRVDRDGSAAGLGVLLAEMEENPQVAGVLLLACDQNGFQPGSVDRLLAGLTKPVFGGIFPEILHGNEKLSLGTIAVGLRHTPPSADCAQLERP